MRLARYICAALLGIVGLLPDSASADLLIVSQNALHLGQGSKAFVDYVPAKNQYVRSLAAWPSMGVPQLTFLQEVMPQAKLSDIQPPQGTALFGALKGTSSYLERYGLVLVNDTQSHAQILCRVDTASLLSAGARIQRSPDATLVRDTSGASPRSVWFLNFHATFGTGSAGLAARRSEIAEIGLVITKLRTHVPSGCPSTADTAIVLGDWNLGGGDAAFHTLAVNAGFAHMGLAPDVPTSLNAKGNRASAYDHFVYDDTRVLVTLTDLPAQPMCSTTGAFVSGILTPVDFPSFRQRCSDHLGIAAIVRIR